MGCMLLTVRLDDYLQAKGEDKSSWGGKTSFGDNMKSGLV